MFLEPKYFRGELALPFLSATSGPAVGQAVFLQTVGGNSLGWFIDKYEPLYLDELLGKTLATNFEEGLKEDPVNPIWTVLKSQMYKETDSNFYSPAANYVYYYAMRTGRTQTVMKGEVRSNSDYADVVSDADKMAKAWNDMVSWNIEIRAFLRRNWDAYKGYAGDDFCSRYGKGIFTPINTFNL